MQENARQGYFNGSRATYGYRAVDTEAHGQHGPKEAHGDRPGRSQGGVVPEHASITRCNFHDGLTRLLEVCPARFDPSFMA
jgi:hypothetical protein